VPPELRTPPPTRRRKAPPCAQVALKAGSDGGCQPHGTVTRDQARAAGSAMRQHFDDIDRQRAGAVSFDDVKRFLRGRGAQLD
jgi:hypothetical protein